MIAFTVCKRDTGYPNGIYLFIMNRFTCQQMQTDDFCHNEKQEKQKRFKFMFSLFKHIRILKKFQIN